MTNPHAVTRDFEAALCEYTHAKYAVAVTSCTMALLLATKWALERCDAYHFPTSQEAIRWLKAPAHSVEIPKRTYISVPMSIIHVGARPVFRDEEWKGMYQLKPLPVWDAARRFTSGMYVPGTFQCVSFHWAKTLAISQGGAILHDDPEADVWLRKARFDGRTEGVAPKDDTFDVLGWHCYVSPSLAAEGLMRLSLLPEHNEDLPNDPYPDLSLIALFH